MIWWIIGWAVVIVGFSGHQWHLIRKNAREVRILNRQADLRSLERWYDYTYDREHWEPFS